MTFLSKDIPDDLKEFFMEDSRVGIKNTHPTVKSLNLMKYLCKLITPPGGIVLDCFAGSGTTGVAAIQSGFKFIGIEREEAYATIAESRIQAAYTA